MSRKPYQYPSKKKKGLLKAGIARPKKPVGGDDVPEVMVVQGQLVDSKEEYRLAKALEGERIPYRYHVVLRGPVGAIGSLELDFLVFLPWGVPLELWGAYYHNDVAGGQDDIRLQILYDYFKQEPMTVWDYELETMTMAREWVRSNLT